MKISCQSCQAKYTIADEKVLGKIVKIRCKKCSATIVINGNEPSASQGAGGSDANVFDYTAQSGAGEWTVNVADGDQRTMTAQEIVQEYRAGVVSDETFCWRDGMPDWLPLREIDALYGSCADSASPASLMPEYASAESMPASTPLFGGHNNEATEQVPVASLRAAQFADAGSNGNGSGAGLFGSPPAAAPSVARRVGGRAGGGDLFGGVSAAGGEDEVMTSVPAGPPEMSADQKMTGQRNENSVLFSLSALTANEKKQESALPQGDGSGLIDIRALSQTMGEKRDERNNHVDDIMNLGGGGAFGAALTAPILAPPPLDTSELMGSGSGGGKSKNLVLFAMLGLVFVGMLGTIVFLVTRKQDAPVTQPTTGPSAAAAAPDPATMPPANTGTGAPLAMNDTPKAADTPKAPTDKPSPVAPPKAGGGGGGGAAVAPPKAGGGGGGGGSGGGAVPDLPKPPAGGGGGGSLAQAMAQSASGGTPAPAAAPAAADKPFDRGAAAAALGAVNVGACKKPDGPTGSGHVSVTFGGDGSVVSAVVDSPPFAGTPVGGCVAGKYRSARVPAFSGGNIKVGKSFIIN